MSKDSDLGQYLNVYPDADSIYAGGMSFSSGKSGVLAVSILAGGTFSASDGEHTATQASTDESGSGATFTVTITSNTVASVDAILTAGSGYIVGEVITLDISTATESVAATLTVDDIG